MTSPRGVIAIIVSVVWVLSAPLAMASSHCMGMGAMCEGPCGASPCAVPGQAQMRAPMPAAPALAPARHVLVTTAPQLLDPPPKAVLRLS